MVTVAILAYYKDFLDECIESVLAQTYKDIKIIIYDDCSPHDLKHTVGMFSDPRLFYVRNEENLGIHANANKALSLCDTEYIFIFHGDDKLLPWSVEKMVEVLDKMPAVGAVTTSTYNIIGSSSSPKRKRRIGGILYRKNELLKAHCKTGEWGICMTQMFRKKAIESVNFRFHTDQFDAYSFYEANSRGLEYYVLNYPLHEYRWHESSSSSTFPIDNWCKSLKDLYDFILNLNLGYDMRRLRHCYFRICIRLEIERNLDENWMDLALRRREFFKEDIGWSVPDSVFEDAVAVTVLSGLIVKVGQREINPREYYDKRNELLKIGVKVPLMRKIKWFLKYIVYMRMFCP
jgi:GT2 family glycosyltransferase